LNIYNKITTLFLALFLAGGNSCSEIKIGIELLMRELDGNALIKNEVKVKSELEALLLTPGKYRITGYTRRIFSPEIQRTPSRYHSFYVVTNNEMIFFTLSFSGTKKTMYSQGAWAIDTDPDRNSYTSFRYGSNEWDVQEIQISRGINTEMTIKKVLYRIDSNITYYYNDHINNKSGMENCNTAVQNTLVENS